MEVATYTYFCDCCGKQVENKTDLKRIEIVCTDDHYHFCGDSGFEDANYTCDHKNVCEDCEQQFKNIYSEFVETMRTKFKFKGKNNRIK